MEHRVLAQAVDPNGEATRRALDGDEVVDRAVGGRLFDPARARSDARLALEPGEGRARDMLQRARARLAKHAQPVVARLVVDDEADVDTTCAGIERDLGAHGARHVLGRARQPVVAQAGREPQHELDGHAGAVARHDGPSGPGEVARPEGRAGV